MIFLKRFKKYTIVNSHNTWKIIKIMVIRDIKINNLDIMKSQAMCKSLDMLHIKYKKFSYDHRPYGILAYRVEYFRDHPRTNIIIQYDDVYHYKITLEKKD